MIPKIDDAFRHRATQVATLLRCRGDIEQPSLAADEALDALSHYLVDVLELFSSEAHLSVLAAKWDFGFSIRTPLGPFRHFVLHFTICSSGFQVCLDDGTMRRVYIDDIIAACSRAENPALTAWRTQVLIHTQLSAIIDQILQGEEQPHSPCKEQPQRPGGVDENEAVAAFYEIP